MAQNAAQARVDAAARSDVVADLAKQLRRAEINRRPEVARDVVSTGLTELDALLPDGGFRRGTIVEWLSSGASGATTLAMKSAAAFLLQRDVVCVIDSDHDFHPTAVAATGIDLNQTIVIRPKTQQIKRRSQPSHTNDALWTLEQTLRSPAIALTVCRMDYLNGHVFRRLQLAAEAGGGLCFLLRPQSASQQPSWADLRLLVESRLESTGDLKPAKHNGSRLIDVTLLRSRTGLVGSSCTISL